MARFDVYQIKGGDLPVVDLQATFLDSLHHRVVAPLIPAEIFFKPLSRLNPRIVLENRTYVLATHLMAAVPTHEIAVKVGNVSHCRDEIVAATDFLFQGF
ncbi:toxin CcdB [Pararhizobium capsulatum DSM 1112]|uniref:Toxin CcdB n=1 Tax=Pararhizobium capsulatum DSM 1112 TaxID=1121113 RepID=A0ABU0BJF9_9HYPH|nr:CcdB family protein [Pararhizobium capsulatum]MDQ0318388.1 toxin CcdB [Pararhizobium capsulatum DSM 1112]